MITHECLHTYLYGNICVHIYDRRPVRSVLLASMLTPGRWQRLVGWTASCALDSDPSCLVAGRTQRVTAHAATVAQGLTQLSVAQRDAGVGLLRMAARSHCQRSGSGVTPLDTRSTCDPITRIRREMYDMCICTAQESAPSQPVCGTTPCRDTVGTYSAARMIDRYLCIYRYRSAASFSGEQGGGRGAVVIKRHGGKGGRKGKEEKKEKRKEEKKLSRYVCIPD